MAVPCTCGCRSSFCGPSPWRSASSSLVFTIVADALLLAMGRRYHHYTILLVRSFVALGETRGMVIRVNDDKASVDMTVK